jgi:hypothetical protein
MNGYQISVHSLDRYQKRFLFLNHPAGCPAGHPACLTFQTINTGVRVFPHFFKTRSLLIYSFLF